MKQQNKHDLEYFKDAPWQVRVRVLAMRYIFFIALTALMSGAVEKLPRQIVSLLRGLL